MMNVLILSAGRRVELTKLFKKAAIDLDVDSKIIVGDASELTPTRAFADKYYKLPLINSGNYVDEVISISKKENVQLIIPTIDTELLILAENKEKIESLTEGKVLISDLSVIKICRDKILTQKYLEDNGFNMPKMLSADEISENTNFPIFIKPKSGSSSIGAYKINNFEEFELYFHTIKDPIIQNFTEGEEYTVDVFLNFKSEVVTIVPRLRLATRSGEISKGKIVKDKLIIEEVLKLMNVMKPIGHITVQLFKTTDKIEFLEINPRFGGGAPMSIQSGANSPKNLFRLLNGEELEYNEDYRENLIFLRYDESVCLNENLEVITFD